jgi:hypothetical protein
MGVRYALALILVACLFVPVFALEPEDAPVEVVFDEVEYAHAVDPIIAPSPGEVIFVEDGDSMGVYVKLGESENIRYRIEFDELVQGPARIGTPVTWTQNGRITTEENVTVNLWNHNETIPGDLLTDLTSISITLNGSVASEVPLFNVPQGTWEFSIEYTTPALEQQIICESLTLADFVPDGAEIISSDLPLDTVVQERCRIRIFHEGSVRYTGVEPDLQGIDPDSIRSIEPIP